MSQKRNVYSIGLNFMGQLGLQNKYIDSQIYSKVIALENQPIKQIEGHFTQSYALLNDSQILHWGWILDSLTTTRTLSYYKRYPNLCRKWQQFSFLGSTLGMRLGSESPLLVNRSLIERERIQKIAVGGSFIMALSTKGNLYAMGENYKGQLGLGDLNYRHNFDQVKLSSQEKIVDVKCGFQHSLVLTSNGTVYGTGRTNNYQFVIEDDRFFVENHSSMKLIPLNKVSQISAGFHHSIFITLDQKIYSCGLNNYGQGGLFETGEPIIKNLTYIPLDLDQDETIKQISSGKSHNILLTSKGRVIFFGATLYNQMGRPQKLNFQSSGPTLIDLDFLKKGEQVTKVKAGFDTNAIFTTFNDCYIWGGEDLKSHGITNYEKPQSVKDILGFQNIRIIDIGLGYMHNFIYVEEL